MPRVAFIGLGRMGHGMAGRYLDAGFAVAVWNRSKAKADDLIARGARWATSPEDAAIDADAVVTMVADDEASREVWLGEGRRGGDHEGGHARDRMLDGLACACARDGARAARARPDLHRLSRHRSAEAAAAGKLTLLVGADPADLEKARPYLAPIGTTIRHFGAVGTGTVFKLINNLMGAVQIASLAEGVAIAEQAGLDMKLVAEALSTGAVASPQVIRHSKRMVARDFSGASFTAALRHKDAAYAVALAETLLPDVPVSRAAVAAYEKAKAARARRRRRPDDRDRVAAEIGGSRIARKSGGNIRRRRLVVCSAD